MIGQLVSGTVGKESVEEVAPSPFWSLTGLEPERKWAGCLAIKQAQSRQKTWTPYLHSAIFTSFLNTCSLPAATKAQACFDAAVAALANFASAPTLVGGSGRMLSRTLIPVLLRMLRMMRASKRMFSSCSAFSVRPSSAAMSFSRVILLIR